MLFGMAVHFDTFANEEPKNGSEGEMRPRLTLRLIRETHPEQNRTKSFTRDKNGTTNNTEFYKNVTKILNPKTRKKIPIFWSSDFEFRTSVS